MENEANGQGTPSLPSLVNVLGKTDFGPAVELFIDRVTGGIGKAAGPLLAVAEAYSRNQVAKVEQAGEMAKLHYDFERRTAERLFAEQLKRQENLDAIAYQAAPQLKEGFDAQALNDDWLAHFRDKAGMVSNSEAQNYWAKLLAVETNQPGTFSTKTIGILADLDASDAKLFTKLCSFAVGAGNQFLLLIFNTDEPLYSAAGLSFQTLTDFDTLGLIRFDSIASFSADFKGEAIGLPYFDQRIIARNPTPNTHVKMTVGSAQFTRAGRELCSIVPRVKSNAFLHRVMEALKSVGLQTSVAPLDNT